MNYTTKQVGKPTAHVTKKKSRLKVYNGHVVFLNDKDNFEFEIHNPTQKSVLCKIKLNGEYISSNGIVVRPGQRVFLERFFDSNNKFEFTTYKVKNTSENRESIELNGDVQVEFYDEQAFSSPSYSRLLNLKDIGTTLINVPGNPNLTNYPYCGDITWTSNSSSVSYSTNISSTLDFGKSTPAGPSKRSIDTGRVEKGEESKQTFINAFENFNYFTSHKVKFKILPVSNKNVESNEIRQYCTECGKSVKLKWKFCPSCGNQI
jgi:hypothetical protein